MMFVGVECGQSLFRLRSWRRGHSRGPHWWRPIGPVGARRGVAVGPVIVVWRR